MSAQTKYYLIWNKVVGKQEGRSFYIFKSGRWIEDYDRVILDRLVGYDPSEPEDSPYRFGSGSIMSEIDEIPYGKAKELIGGNI